MFSITLFYNQVHSRIFNSTYNVSLVSCFILITKDFIKKRRKIRYTRKTSTNASFPRINISALISTVPYWHRSANEPWQNQRLMPARLRHNYRVRGFCFCHLRRVRPLFSAAPAASVFVLSRPVWFTLRSSFGCRIDRGLFSFVFRLVDDRIVGWASLQGTCDIYIVLRYASGNSWTNKNVTIFSAGCHLRCQWWRGSSLFCFSIAMTCALFYWMFLDCPLKSVGFWVEARIRRSFRSRSVFRKQSLPKQASNPQPADSDPLRHPILIPSRVSYFIFYKFLGRDRKDAQVLRQTGFSMRPTWLRWNQSFGSQKSLESAQKAVPLGNPWCNPKLLLRTTSAGNVLPRHYPPAHQADYPAGIDDDC